MRRILYYTAVLVVVCALAPDALAQDPPPTYAPPTQVQHTQQAQQVPAGYMPNWIFYSLVGMGTAIVGALIAAIKVLYSRTEAKKAPPGLTKKQEATLVAIQSALTELVQIVKNDNTEMRSRLGELTARNERQQDKMLKLAVRSQRAIEAVANLPVPEIEEEIDSDIGGE